MMEKRMDHSQDVETRAFNRRIKYALFAFAIVEFIVTAAAIYYKVKG